MSTPTLPKFTPQEMEAALRSFPVDTYAYEETFADDDIAQALLEAHGIEDPNEDLIDALIEVLQEVLSPYSIGSISENSQEGLGWSAEYNTYRFPSGAVICILFNDGGDGDRVVFASDEPTDDQILDPLVNQWFENFEGDRWTGGELEVNDFQFSPGETYPVMEPSFWEGIFGFPWLQKDRLPEAEFTEADSTGAGASPPPST